MTSEDLEAIIFEVNNRYGFAFSLVKHECLLNYLAVYEGEITADFDKRFIIQLCFEYSFPLVLPKCLVANPPENALHISKGSICYCDQDSILIDQDKPVELVKFSVDQIIRTLNIRLGTDEYCSELKREFLAYWLDRCSLPYYSIIESESCNFSSVKIILSDSFFFISKTFYEAETYMHNFAKIPRDKRLIEKTGILLRLRNNIDPYILANSNEWSDIWHFIRDNSDISIRKKFLRYINSKTRQEDHHIIISIPYMERDIIIGFLLQISGGSDYSLSNIQKYSLKRMYVNRVDSSFLLLRGGNMIDVSNKHILLLGCGSVGGYIAENLVKSGIKRLSIIDKDNLFPENIYRHLLGYDSIDLLRPINKADLVKTHLEKNYPEIEITSISDYNRKVEDLFHDQNQLKQYDLVISALGSPTLNIFINRQLYHLNKRIPFVVCFNEPYGIGGHVIVSNINDSSCMECLYTDILSSGRVAFRGSLVEADQYFSKNIGGCGSSYTPYCGLDSQQTAIIAAKQVINVLLNKTTENYVITWAGEDDLLTEHGYKSSNRFKEIRNSYISNIPISQNNNCRCCQV